MRHFFPRSIFLFSILFSLPVLATDGKTYTACYANAIWAFQAMGAIGSSPEEAKAKALTLTERQGGFWAYSGAFQCIDLPSTLNLPTAAPVNAVWACTASCTSNPDGNIRGVTASTKSDALTKVSNVCYSQPGEIIASSISCEQLWPAVTSKTIAQALDSQNWSCSAQCLYEEGNLRTSVGGSLADAQAAVLLQCDTKSGGVWGEPTCNQLP